MLGTGGFAILTVPQSDSAHDTYEDPAVDTPEARTREYGQSDHVRNYGADFADRVASAGFDVTCVGSGDFAPVVVARHVLEPPVPLAAGWGWNNRLIYFAERR